MTTQTETFGPAEAEAALTQVPAENSRAYRLAETLEEAAGAIKEGKHAIAAVMLAFIGEQVGGYIQSTTQAARIVAGDESPAEYQTTAADAALTDPTLEVN